VARCPSPSTASAADAALGVFRLGGIGTREMSFLVFVLVMVGLNEGVFKVIYRQARPSESCNYSCGFPSGHAVMSVGFFTLMFLDATYRTMPRLACSQESALAAIQLRAESKRTFLGWTLREWLLGDARGVATLLPLSAAHTLGHSDFVYFAAAWGFLLLPVPFSRVILKDHTPAQVLTGATIGTVEAVIYFAIIRHAILPAVNYRLSQRIGFVFVHNFPLPMMEVLSRAYTLLAKHQQGRTDVSPPEELVQLMKVSQEVDWYLAQAQGFVDTARHRWYRRLFVFDDDMVNTRRDIHMLEAVQDKLDKVLSMFDHDASASSSDSAAVLC